MPVFAKTYLGFLTGVRSNHFAILYIISRRYSVIIFYKLVVGFSLDLRGFPGIGVGVF